jgi:hypothetical protein
MDSAEAGGADGSAVRERRELKFIDMKNSFGG